MKISILQLGSILLTSLQDGLTDRDLADLQTNLLASIGETEALGVVLDISALEIVDTYVVRMLSDTASMAGVLGCSVVVSGIRPAVALTLVEMRQEMIGFSTALNLEQGVAMVRSMIGEDDEKADAATEREGQAADEREEISEID